MMAQLSMKTRVKQPQICRFFACLALTLLATGSIAACSGGEGADSPASAPTPASKQEANPMKIRLTINGNSTTATLDDNPTAKDFLSMLPMTLTLDDYAATEKIAYPPRKLSTQGAPAGIDPEVGDIAYYAPWGNLALYYRDFGYSSGLIRLGRFDSGVDLLNVQGSLKVIIEAANP